MASVSAVRSSSVLLSCVALLSGCGIFTDMHADHSGGHRAAPPAPRVRVVEVRLTEHPTSQQLAAHYCTDVAPGTRLGPAGAAACRALGAAPSDSELQFHWAIDLDVTNASSVRMPLVTALVGLTAGPDDAESRGAVCVRLCPDDETCPQDDGEHESACESTEPTLTDLSALGDVTPRLVTAVALDAQRFDALRVQTIAPHATIHFTIELAVDTEAMLTLVARTNEASVAQARQGHASTFSVPYTVHGTIWVDEQGYGPVGASFERTTGTWEVAAP